MKFVSFISGKGLRNFLLLALMLSDSNATSLHDKATYLQVLANKRYDVAPRDVIARSSATQCAAACRDASWCVAVNLFTGGERVCQLLADEASNETLLETVDGWKYMREYL